MPDAVKMEFVEDAREHLQAADHHLLILEKRACPENLHGLLRHVHTIKGNCGFLSLPNLQRLTHQAENILHEFRDRDVARLPATAVDLLFRVLDVSGEVLDCLARGGPDRVDGMAALTEELIRYQSRLDTPREEATDPAVAGSPSPAASPDGPGSHSSSTTKIDLQVLLDEIRPGATASSTASLKNLEDAAERAAADVARWGGPNGRSAMALIQEYLSQLRVYGRPLNRSARMFLSGLVKNLEAWLETESRRRPGRP